MQEPTDPATPENQPGLPQVNLPRRNLSAERQQGTAPTGNINNQLANLVDSVMVLANHLGTDQASTPESATDRSGRRVKKFQRSGVIDDNVEKAAATTDVPDDEPGRPDAATLNKNVAWPRQAAPDSTKEARLKRKRANKRKIAFAVQLGGLSLLALGFLAGRMSTSPTAGGEAAREQVNLSKSPEGTGFALVNEQALQVANEAMLKARANDLDGARGIYEEALKKRLELPGVHYQLARLALRRDDFLDADLNLDRSGASGEFLGPAYYTRARMAGMKGSYADVVRYLQAAVYSEPFNARYLFYLGEAQRRRGQTKQAVEVFEQALDRAHTTSEGRLYRFKQNLAKIETGDAAFNSELDDHLKQPEVTADWWLLAAARHITRSAFPEAAEALKKASSLLPPPLFALQTKDYLFQSAQAETALTGLLKTPAVQDSTEINGPFLDPAVLPAELADPAIWPVALSNPHKGM